MQGKLGFIFNKLINKINPRHKLNAPTQGTTGVNSVVSFEEIQKQAQSSPQRLRGVRYTLSSNSTVFNSVIPASIFQQWMNMLESVLTFHLYQIPSEKPPVNSIRIEVASFNGVAYTVNSGNGGKLIRVSSGYIDKIPVNDRYKEISGVVLHELTHALQYNGTGRCPWYFIEGIADFIRMKGNVPNRTWNRSFGTYKNGYSNCAFFFDWLNTQYPNFVKKFNLRMRSPYNDDVARELTGKSWDVLFSDYKAAYNR
jgi:hypothetical protein